MAAVFARVAAGARRDPLVAAMAVVTLLSVAAAALLYSPLPALIPIGVLGLAVALQNVRLALFACFAAIPLSTEVSFGSVGTDLPTEPIMVLLLGLGILYLAARATRIEAAFIRHPISLLLLLHLSWILLTTLTSAFTLTSAKYLLAKLWYVVPFYVLAGLLLRRDVHLRTLMVWVAVPLAGVLVWCIARHAALGFTFEDVNRAMAPFFRNHVTYAALTSILLPLLIGAAFSFRKNSWARWLLFGTSVLSLVAVYTSFTRAAFVGIVIGLAFLLVMRWRLTRLALVLATALLIGVVGILMHQNRFLFYAPDFNRTITHTDFNSLVEATYKLEDISTMERVYRWVAGAYMTAERPLLGWGPGNYYRYYRGYALESFRTYVSDNPEKSGIHNYLLMTLVEQGWPGLLIFFSLCVAGLHTAERAYHRARTPAERRAVMMLAASLVINLSFQLINDMLETDKSGPWFFLTLALLVNLDLRGQLADEWDSLRAEPA